MTFSFGPRCAIETLALLPDQAELCIAGRVLAVAAGRARVADGSGSVEVELAGPAEIVAGDIVQVNGSWQAEGERVRCAQLARLSAYQAAAPFPSPGGEFLRLHAAPAPLTRADNLKVRARCVGAIRAFFDGRGYTEVQTPLRVSCPGLEPHLRAMPAPPGFLITSPEYHMKRLLAAGLERIYFLGPCWRGDEVGRHHLGEFCMLEWYRAYSGLDELMVETEQLLASVARQVAGTTRLVYRGRPLELQPPAERLTFAEAFWRFAGLEIARVVDAEELRRRAEAAGLGPFPPGERFEAVAAQVMVERVEPGLAALPRPALVHDFPAPLAALARLKPDDPTVAERFELYAGGLELANAFGELGDPAEQRRRLEEDQRVRRECGAPVTPIDERFLAALSEGLPPAAGIALGVDRLVMLLADAADIRDTVAFAPDEI
jgi:lysyl-tRNA synthetase class 2